MLARLKDACLASFLAAAMVLPLAGIKTMDGLNGLVAEWHPYRIILAAVVVFLGRFLMSWIYDLRFAERSEASTSGKVIVTFYMRWLQSPFYQNITRIFPGLTILSAVFLIMAAVFPFTPLATRYSLDVAIMVLTYVMLAWGLNITVGYAGLLDLGYAGFYALGAYAYALIAEFYGIGFWTALPISCFVAAGAGLILGLPVLRLRGDYFAVVTLGFGEIIRLVLINWTGLTGGPNGITGIPRPTLFGLDFARQASEGRRAFHDFFGVAFSPIQRVIFIYVIILVLAVLVGFISTRLRRTPLGRAWEAFREDETACASLGINRWQIKLMAYCSGAAVAGAAGAFFAARQGFISPESFTFTESATMLAIVILGGIGHPLGIVLAAVFVIGMPELFRDLEQYRMLAFGAGLVLIMIWRPGGMMATREPTVKLGAASS